MYKCAQVGCKLEYLPGVQIRVTVPHVLEVDGDVVMSADVQGYRPKLD